MEVQNPRSHYNFFMMVLYAHRRHYSRQHSLFVLELRDTLKASASRLKEGLVSSRLGALQIPSLINLGVSVDVKHHVYSADKTGCAVSAPIH